VDPAPLERLERELLDPRTPPARLTALIDDAFAEFGASGRTYDKAAILDLLRAHAAGDPESFRLQDLWAQPLAQGVVLVTYRSTRTPAAGTPIHSLRCSIWVFRAGEWRLRFHQGTPTRGLDATPLARHPTAGPPPDSCKPTTRPRHPGARGCACVRCIRSSLCRP
jgi:hypothetical protein